uniref:Uncharacterized protein n=1 Tax=Lepeophtheirus salmonis TaxID=72036 RepID=A0A0K2UQN3_LEPSM
MCTQTMLSQLSF